MKKNKNDKLKEYVESHQGRRPMSRRDFLAAGLIGFSGTLMGPGLLNRAWALDCPKPDLGSSLAPFVTINLAGGAMLASNFVPQDQGEQPLSSYNDMGLGNGAVPLQREFGNVPFAADGLSQLLVGLLETTTQQTRDNTAFVAVNVRSRDDSGDNPLDVSGMVSAAGLIGETLPNLGIREGESGIRQKSAKRLPPNPLIVSRFEDIQGAIGAPGALGRLNEGQKNSFFRLVHDLNSSQLTSLANLNGGSKLESLVKCATGQNIELSQLNADGLDVRANAALSPVWGVDVNSNAGDENVVFGSMILSALNGAAGTVSLEKGGYDYHNNTRTRGNQRDADAGRLIGRVLQSAAAMGKSVFLYVTTDGSCRSAKSDDRQAPWTSDRGSAGCVYMMAFHPSGRPATNGFQLGHFTQGQAADDKFITGGSPELAAAAVFANYLRFSGKIDLLDSVIPGTFSTTQLDTILKFG